MIEVIWETRPNDPRKKEEFGIDNDCALRAERQLPLLVIRIASLKRLGLI